MGYINMLFSPDKMQMFLFLSEMSRPLECRLSTFKMDEDEDLCLTALFSRNKLVLRGHDTRYTQPVAR